MALSDPAKWLLPFDTTGGEGRPWADGTSMAARAGHAGKDPWDTPCEVTPIAGGFAAMKAIREVLTQAIADAEASAQPPGKRGHVYVAGWRLNPQRDTSDRVTAWTMPPTPPPPGERDETALGLLLRLMQAGVQIRVMIWLPTRLQAATGAGPAHVEEHFYVARAVGAESDRLKAKWAAANTPLAGDGPIGVVALDARTAGGSVAGSHHQKTIVVRGLNGDVAFVGGVDLGFTRRDAPAADPTSGKAGQPRDGWNAGDWQSTSGIPTWSAGKTLPAWPRDSVTTYSALDGVDPPTHRQTPDIPDAVYGFSNQIWHDQHLQLRGPIVQTLEDQFAERWRDSADVYDLSSPGNTFGQQVIFSSPDAIDANGDIAALPDSQPAAAAAAGSTAAVQMLRTIPWRDARTRPPFQRAEFTAMAAVSHAVATAEHLIWIFDQYFWSLALARQLNKQLHDRADLRVIVILPPFADSDLPSIIHVRRNDALAALVDGVASQVGVYFLWDPRGSSNGRGVYCHAKVQLYDGGLMICGSANMNRRSFLCDSEIACAVADEPTVAAHQQRLWKLLFSDVAGAKGQWPNPDFTQAASGAAFFTAFKAAVADPSAGIWPDVRNANPPSLPNGVTLPTTNPAAGAAMDYIFDPTSVDPGPLERQVDERDAQGNLVSRDVRLDDVVKRVEATVVDADGDITTPNRYQSSDLRLVLASRVGRELGL